MYAVLPFIIDQLSGPMNVRSMPLPNNLTSVVLEWDVRTLPLKQLVLETLRKCYPELPDCCWTGRKQSQKCRSKRQTVTSPSGDPVQQTTGPVTRSMTQKS